jgi:glycosyltransferase involved in cell wall biosynthesis
MRIGVFHPGTQHSWQTALAFQEGGALSWYATSAYYDPNRWPYRIESFVPKRYRARLHREFTRRYTPLLNPYHVRQFGWWEWIETAATRLKVRHLASSLNEIGNRRFGTDVIRLIEREPVDVVWGYNSSALEVFRWAKRRDIRCILDQTIGHPFAQNAIMSSEQARHPEFFVNEYIPFSPNVINRQNEEIALADQVIVGSTFCARTLIDNGCSDGKIQVVPYGYDETLAPTDRPVRPDLPSRPLKFLFAGTIGPRKGVQYLLPAFARLPKNAASLSLLGSLEIPEQTLKRFLDRVTYVPQVPRTEVMQYFLECDCFIFPSLFEGGGIVLYEARGAGLGIIQSDACGDGVVENRNGVILPSISEDTVLSAMEFVLNHRDQMRNWQHASWELRRERTWSQYREKIRQLVTHH